MTRVIIRARGLDEAIADVDGWADRARNLRPLTDTVRDRWHEAEGRILTEGRGWAPHKPSTVRRYRWPIRGRRAGRGGQLGRVSGQMHAALTTPGARGVLVRDTGNLRVAMGPKRRGPVAHAAIFHTGRSAQRARPAVGIDDRALTALSDDVAEFVIGTHAGRRTR